MSYREDPAAASPVGYAVGGLLLALFSAVFVGLSGFLIAIVLVGGYRGDKFGIAGAILLLLAQAAGVLIFGTAPIALLASSVIAFTLVARSIRATDTSAPLVIVGRQNDNVRLGLEYFPLTRTAWSGFFTDLRATMMLPMSWRLFFGLYAIWIIPTTVFLEPVFAGATVPLVVAEALAGVAFIVWHRIAKGRMLVKSTTPRARRV